MLKFTMKIFQKRVDGKTYIRVILCNTLYIYTLYIHIYLKLCCRTAINSQQSNKRVTRAYTTRERTERREGKKFENMFQFILISVRINMFNIVHVCIHVCSWQGQILGMICTAMNTRKIYFDFVRQVIVKTWIPFGHLTGTAAL